MPTQDEYNVTKNRSRKIYAKVNLLNFNMQVVDEISGVVIGEPTFSNTATSDIRRTSSITISPKDSSYSIQKGSKIWIDKFAKIYLGIENRKGDIVYHNMGTYLVNNPSHTFDAVTNTITLQLVDLMAKLTGLRNGNLEGMEYQIPSGSDIRQVIIATLSQAGFTKYVIGELDIKTIPNDLTISAGSTVYSMLAQINSVLLSDYQMYFDVNGVFHFEKIPSGKNETIMIDDDIWNSVYIGHTVNTTYDNVKNYIEVYGKTHDVSYYNDATWVTQYSLLNVVLSDMTSLMDGDEIGFTTPSGTYSASGVSLRVNSGTSYPIKWEDGMIPTLLPSTYYVVIYKSSGSYMKFLGRVTPRAIAEETNPESPFNTTDIGRIRLVLSGGEYDNISSDDLAQQRADYELYLNCRLQDNITITCEPIYWADVNWVIEITLPSKFGVKIKETYITKSISTTFGVTGTQTIQAMRYYPTYQ